MTQDTPIAAYKQSGFAAGLGIGARPALLLIDIVGAYLIEGSPLRAPVEGAVAASARLLAAARAARVPVLHTCVRYARDGADGGVFFRKIPALRVFAEGADPALGAFVDAVAPAPGEIVIAKQYASAFFGTSLASTLTAMRCDSVVICGLSTSGCVRATALDACQHGFAPTVVRDAVGDRTAAIHDANLLDLEAKYADVIGLDAALAAFEARR